MSQLAARRRPPEVVLDHIADGSDGVVDLVEKGVVTGTRKRTHRNKIIATTVLGTQRLFDFLAELRGSTIRERTRRLIAIAHPRFHDELERAARAMGYLA